MHPPVWNLFVSGLAEKIGEGLATSNCTQDRVLVVMGCWGDAIYPYISHDIHIIHHYTELYYHIPIIHNHSPVFIPVFPVFIPFISSKIDQNSRNLDDFRRIFPWKTWWISSCDREADRRRDRPAWCHLHPSSDRCPSTPPGAPGGPSSVMDQAIPGILMGF